MQRRSPFFASLFIAGLLASLFALPAHAQGPTPVTTIQNGDQGTVLQTFFDGGLLAPGKFGDIDNYSAPYDSIPAEGAGTRMMWYPAKAAFRAGRVGPVREDNWDASNIGDYSVAFGFNTEASDLGAAAMGSFTTASGGSATAMGFATTASGGSATAMGSFTTAATDESLSIGEYNSANSGSSGDNTLFVAGNGSGFDSRSDALVLKKDGDLAVGHSTPVSALHAQESVAEGGATNLGRHVAVIENTSSDGTADMLGLKSNLNDPGVLANFISFIDADEQIGQIEGNGSGGITITGTSADYAEELPVAGGAEVPEATDVVGVHGGEVSLKASGADRVMIASTAPMVTGNATTDTEADDARRVEVAFIGQVPAKVRGPVDTGDLIVASGQNDGTARAVAPEEYRREEHGPIAGQAWEAKATDVVGEVTVAVGLGRSGAVAERLNEQQTQIDSLKEQVDQIESMRKRLAALEAERSGTLPAGWGGSALFAVLLGLGGLAAGLLWHGRA